MRFTFILLQLLLISSFGFGQDSEHIDQLNKDLKGNIADSVRVRLLAELSSEYKIADTTKMKEILGQVLGISTRINYSKGIGLYYERLGEMRYYHGYYTNAIKLFELSQEEYISAGDESYFANVTIDMGNAFLFLSNFDIALEKYMSALDIYEKNGNQKGISRCLNNMGIIYKTHGEYKKALTTYEEVVNIYLENNDRESLADTYINIGVVYVLIGEYHKALANFNNALAIAHESGNREQEAITLMNSGVIYTKMNDYSKALNYYELALEVSKAIGDKVEISKCLTNIGTNFIALGEFNKAEDYIRKGLLIKEELGDRLSMSNCYNFLAEISFFRKNYTESVTLDRKAVKIKLEVNDPEGLARCYANLGRTFLALGQTKTAIQYADSSLSFSIPIGAVEHIVTAYNIKKQVLQETGNFKEALEMAELYKMYSDSLMNERKSIAIKEIEFNYLTHGLEEENRILKLQSELDGILIRRHRKILYTVIIAIVIFIILLVLLITIQVRQKMYNISLEKKNLIITRQNVKLDTLNRTKDKILSVITHDLRGTIGNQLTALSVLAKEEFRDEEERKVVFSRLANSATLSLELLENLALWTKIQEGTIEYKPTEGFIDQTFNEVIELFRESILNKELSLVVNIPEGLNSFYDFNMIKSVLKNLMSNSIKFTVRKGEIKVEITTVEDRFKLSISDNGTGISKGEASMLQKGNLLKLRRGTENEKGSGLGLSIVSTFLDYHHTCLSIAGASDKGTTVSFELPCLALK